MTQSFINSICLKLIESWPIIAAILLIALKQLYKLYVNHKPDKVDYIKAVTSLPLDVSFMVVGIFFKIIITPNANTGPLSGLFVLYFFVGLFTTILWRVCENAIKSDALQHVVWALALNSMISGVGLFLAIQYVG